MAKIMDLEQVDVLITRYTNFEINPTTLKRIIEDVFMKLPLSMTLKSLSVDLYVNDKVAFKRGLIVVADEISNKMKRLESNEKSYIIFSKLIILITKILQSDIFKNI